MEQTTKEPISSTTKTSKGNESKRLNPLSAMSFLVKEGGINLNGISEDNLNVFKTLKHDGLAEIDKTTIKPTEKAIKEVNRQTEAEKEYHDPEQAEKEKAEQILNSDNPPEEILKLLDKVIAGEKSNKLIIFTLLLSGKSLNPKEKQIILIKGEAGGGKTTLMKLADFYNTKSVARFTQAAMDYSDFSDVEVLKIQELNDDEKQGTGNTKFLSSEDGGYTVEYTIRGKDGRFTTEQKNIPPLTVITSTTTVELDSQLERRAWILNPDITPKQTARVLNFKAWMKKQDDLKTMGRITQTEYEKAKKVLKYVIMQIKPVNVVIPFMDSLISLMKDEKVRVRGDIDKIVAFVSFFHWLYYKKLQKVEINGQTIVFADPEITMRAVEIIHDPLMNMLSGIEAREMQVLNELENINRSKKEDSISREDRQKLMKNLGFTSEKRIMVILNKLEDSGYFTSEGGVRGSPKVFILSDHLSQIKLQTSQVLVYSGQIQNVQNTILQMAKEGYNYLKPILESPGVMEGYLEIINRLSETNDKNAKDITLPQGAEIPETIENQNKPEISGESIHSGQIPIVRNNEKQEKKNYSENSIDGSQLPQADRLKAIFELGRKLTQGGEYFSAYEIEIKLSLPEGVVEHDLTELAKTGKISEVSPGRWKA